MDEMFNRFHNANLKTSLKAFNFGGDYLLTGCIGCGKTRILSHLVKYFRKRGYLISGVIQPRVFLRNVECYVLVDIDYQLILPFMLGVEVLKEFRRSELKELFLPYLCYLKKFGFKFDFSNIERFRKWLVFNSSLEYINFKFDVCNIGVKVKDTPFNGIAFFYDEYGSFEEKGLVSFKKILFFSEALRSMTYELQLDFKRFIIVRNKLISQTNFLDRYKSHIGDFVANTVGGDNYYELSNILKKMGVEIVNGLD